MIKKLKLTQINLKNLLLYSFAIFPITFLIGNFAINLFIVFFCLLFLIGFYRKKFNLKDHDKYTIYLLIFFFISLIINLLFSNNFQLTLPRVLKFSFIIGSVLCFRQALISLDKSEQIKIYKIWSIIFAIVLFDIIFEIIFKSNIFGFSSIIPGRITSFSADEMNIGHFFFAFSLIILSYLNTKNKNIYIIFFISLFFIFISFLIGERSNFLKTFLIIVFFIFVIHQIKIRYKILSIMFLTAIFILILNLNQSYKDRYFEQFTNVLTKDGISYYLNTSIYGAHYKVAYEIFKDNPYFGVGIKNFRLESFKDKYDYLNHKEPERRGNTHPHQTHLEILSETGLFGYFCFIVFILISIIRSFKSYKKSKNLFQLSSMLYVIASLLPLLPSGSFFSTYSAGLFWLNYSIMVSYNNIKH